MTEQSHYEMPAEPFDHVRIRAILHHIRPEHPVARAAQELLAGKVRRPDGLPELIASLSIARRRQMAEQAATVWVVAHSDLLPEERATAIDGFLTFLAQPRPMSVGWAGVVLAAAVLAVLFKIWVLVGLAAASFVTWGFWRLHAMIALEVPFASAQAEAAWALASFGTIEAISPLLRALDGETASVRAGAAGAVRLLLPQITEAHEGLVDTGAIDALVTLCKHRDPTLAGLAVQVLAVLGPPRVLPALRDLHTDAANAAIQAIEERAERRRLRDTLGRPTSGATPPDTLPRPAANTQHDQELLRPSDDEETD